MLDCFHQELMNLELIDIAVQLTTDEYRHRNADDSPQIVATWFQNILLNFSGV